jgi:hypothetical protein
VDAVEQGTRPSFFEMRIPSIMRVVHASGSLRRLLCDSARDALMDMRKSVGTCSFHDVKVSLEGQR